MVMKVTSIQHPGTRLHRLVVPIAVMMLSTAVGAQQTRAAAPTITGISVSSVTTPSAAFSFSVTGTNFVAASRRQRGTEVVTEEYGTVSSSVNSSTQITVKVPALAAVSTAEALHLYVETPGSGRSAASTDVLFTINPPISGTPPTLVSLSQNSVTTPSPAFTFSAAGTGFVAATTALPFHTQMMSVEWGPLPTKVTSSTELTVYMPALRKQNSLVLHLYAVNPDLTQSSISAELTLTINPPTQGPPPTLASLSESSITTPTAAFSFMATGTNFVASTSAKSGHTKLVSVELGPLPTTVNSPTELTINMPAIGKVKTPVVLHLYVENPDLTQSSTAAELTFTINPPVPGTAPTLTSLSATSVTPPVRDYTFTVTGTGFTAGRGERNSSVVYSEEYGPLETSGTSATELTVYLGSIRKVAAPNVLHLYVQNPDGTRSLASEDIAFTIQ
jgi:hypothetical protein